MTLGVPTSPGVAAAAARDTLVARYNDLDVGRAGRSTQNRGQIAAVFVEPIAGNMGVVAAAGRIPRRACATICDSRGRAARLRRSDLRVPRRGRRRAAGLRRQAGPHLPGQDHRRRPAGGRVRRTRGRDGAGRAGGTGLSGGHAVGKSAGDDRGALVAERAVAEALSAPREAGRARWPPGLADAARDAGVPLQVNAFGSLRHAVLHEPAGARLSVGAAADTAAYGRFFRGMLARGVYPPPSQFEAWFISGGAHGEGCRRRR